MCFSFLRAPEIVVVLLAVFTSALATIDFFVFGFIVIGGACGLFLSSDIDGFDEPASTALIYCYVKYLL